MCDLVKNRTCYILSINRCVCSLEEEINNMRKELEKYGIQMPSFNKIGGILANELSVDEAACKFCRRVLNIFCIMTK